MAVYLKKNSISLLLMVFVVVGLVLTFVAFGYPYIHLLRAKQWQQTQCTILNSNIISKQVTSHGKHGPRSSTVTKIDLLYEYIYDGRNFQGDRYGFFELLNRTKKSANAIVSKYPRGSRTACYVNPDNPSEAVLQRNFETYNLLGLTPLVFTAAGLLGLWQRWKLRRLADKLGKVHSEQMQLKSQSRIQKAFAWFVFALIFCASTAFLWKAGQILIASAFGFFAILLILISISLFLALFNPQVQLKLIPSVIEVGKTGMLNWQIQGRIERLKKLKILLECRKRTTAGKKTSTQKIYSEELFETSNPSEMNQGEIGFVIGPQQRVTQYGDGEEIRWYAIVKGNIKKWPDIDDEFEFQVVKPDNSWGHPG